MTARSHSRDRRNRKRRIAATRRTTPVTVDLVRHTEPLRHTTGAKAWPAGTHEAATALDKLDVPLDATVKAALAALKDAGAGKQTRVVSAALKWRRTRTQADESTQR